MNEVRKRLDVCVDRLASTKHWSPDELRALFSTGAMEALFAVEMKLHQDDVARLAKGQRLKNTEAIAWLRREYEAVASMVAVSEASGT